MRANWRFYCYPRPGFFEGLARIIDLGNTPDHYPRFRSAWEADTFALRSDWIMVGQDIRDAIGEFKAIENSKLTHVS